MTSNDQNPDRTAFLSKKFDEYVLGGIPRLRRLGYNPFQFLEMVERYRGAVGATRHLLADPRHTSYGFQRLLELERLEDTVEFAACLPWFNELFRPIELNEARTRLIVHEFPIDARLAAAAASPPEWLADL
ncbi:hypothetical protein V6V47_21735 [Micromonospora sp. CPCC 205539]|uniref:hypothetical protein n=1 Tax=Micromonospora sp. CPCC 205539 TaxID=3122408 RepID=UPI002FEED24F